jgi:hypothetical protein
MTANQFRKLALALPDVIEKSHMGHPDFRVRDKVFASLGPRDAWGMVRLPLQEQIALAALDPDAFEPFKGAWGARGYTKVILRVAEATTVRRALEAAWRHTTPR